MSEDLREETSAIRRSIRRIEDDVAEMERKKAAHTDVEQLVAKQSDMDTFTRGRLSGIQAEMDEIRRLLKGIGETLSSIDDRLTKHKKETENEVQALKTPPAPPPQAEPASRRVPGAGLPIQIQIIMYILIGVGILALLQSAPSAVGAMFQRVM